MSLLYYVANMDYKRWMNWPYPRIPSQEELDDFKRFESYWKYLIKISPQDKERPSITRLEGFELKDIANYDHADYEAFHMLHSVGANYDHYSKLGKIYSIRTKANQPVCTFLVKDNICIHARVRDNLALDDDTFKLLQSFLAKLGFSHLPREQL